MPVRSFFTWRPVALAALAASALTAPALPAHAADARFSFERTPGRLSKAVRPTHQALTLTLDPERDRFDGETTVTLDVRSAVPQILMHGQDLEWRSASLDGRELVLAVDAAARTWTFTPADGQAVVPGRHRLQIAWSGRVQGSDTGLYAAPYTADGRPQRWLATQLEAVGARQMFPSFDEPSFRVRYQLTLRAPAAYGAVSNMPEVAHSDEGGLRVHRFAPTPPMPSYLVALAVGRFDVREGRAGATPTRVITAPGKAAQGDFALQAVADVLPFYTRYFGVPYALPKLDMVAVPATQTGAMENWGLVIYAEGLLLVDPARTDAEAQQRNFAVIAHETAHQWFGNLVTAASWGEIWLNEAFADWMETKAAEVVHPQWRVGLQRRAAIDEALARDAGPATRPIRGGEVDEEEVFSVFDDITYAKGGAVLTMLEHAIGAERFRRGLAAYMKERRFSNATAGDLWFHMARASGRDVGALAASWTDQPGFPLVSVESRCVAGHTELQARQQRFNLGGEAVAGLWQVPLTVRHGGRERTLLLGRAEQRFVLPGCPAAPLVANPDGLGFYRVAYASEARAALAAAFPTLPAATQITLLSDSLALVQAGRQPLTDFTALLARLPQVQGEGREALYGQAMVALDFLRQSLAGTPQAEPLAQAARALLAPRLAALGWEPRAGESFHAQAERGAVIQALARFGDPGVLAQAAERFQADVDGRRAMPGPLVQPIAVAAARGADAQRFGVLVQRLHAADNEQDRWAYAEAVAAVDEPALAQRALALSLDPELPGNVALRLVRMVATQGHAAMALDFAESNWEALSRRAGLAEGVQQGLLPGAVSGTADLALAARMRQAQEGRVGASGRAPAEQALARVGQRAAVRERAAAQGCALDRLAATLNGGPAPSCG